MEGFIRLDVVRRDCGVIFFYKGFFLFRFLSIFTEKFFKVSGRYVVRDG